LASQRGRRVPVDDHQERREHCHVHQPGYRIDESRNLPSHARQSADRSQGAERAHRTHARVIVERRREQWEPARRHDHQVEPVPAVREVRVLAAEEAHRHNSTAELDGEDESEGELGLVQLGRSEEAIAARRPLCREHRAVGEHRQQRQLIKPCPFYDEDGRHAQRVVDPKTTAGRGAVLAAGGPLNALEACADENWPGYHPARPVHQRDVLRAEQYAPPPLPDEPLQDLDRVHSLLIQEAVVLERLIDEARPLVHTTRHRLAHVRMSRARTQPLHARCRRLLLLVPLPTQLSR
jgi:hypothetical protein